MPSWPAGGNHLPHHQVSISRPISKQMQVNEIGTGQADVEPAAILKVSIKEAELSLPGMLSVLSCTCTRWQAARQQLLDHACYDFQTDIPWPFSLAEQSPEALTQKHLRPSTRSMNARMQAHP